MIVALIMIFLVASVVAAAIAENNYRQGCKRGAECVHEEYRHHDMRLRLANMRIEHLEREIAIHHYMQHRLVLADIKEDNDGDLKGDEHPVTS
jgi:hypothetical protein